MNKKYLLLYTVFFVCTMYTSEIPITLAIELEEEHEKNPIIAIYLEDFSPTGDWETSLFQKLNDLPKRIFSVEDTNVIVNGDIIKFIYKGTPIIGREKRNEQNTKITFIPRIEDPEKSLYVQYILDSQLFLPESNFLIFGSLSSDDHNMDIETVNANNSLFAEIKKDDKPYLIYFFESPLTLKMPKELKNIDKEQKIYNSLKKICKTDNAILLKEMLKKHKNLLNYCFNSATPLLIKACQCNALQVARLLLYNGADPNLSDIIESTLPLIEAIKIKSFPLLYELLLYGANRHIKSEECLSPFDYLYEKYIDKQVKTEDQKIYKKMMTFFILWKTKSYKENYKDLIKDTLAKCQLSLLKFIARECKLDARKIFIKLLENDKIAELIYLIKNRSEYRINLIDESGLTLLQYCLQKESSVSYEIREFIVRLLLERYDLPELIANEEKIPQEEIEQIKNEEIKNLAKEIKKSEFFTMLSPSTKIYIHEYLDKKRKKHSIQAIEKLQGNNTPKGSRALRNVRKD